MRGLIVFSVLLVLAPNTHGQSIAGGHLGIKGGVSAALMTFPGDEARPYLGYEINDLYRSNLLRPQVGVFATFTLHGIFALQPELHYVQRGLDAGTSFLYEDVGYRVTIHYLEVPLLLKLRLPVPGAVHPALYAGPFTALKLGATKTIVLSGKNERTALPNVRRVDYGLAFGAEVEWHIHSRPIVLDVRFTLGLADVMHEMDGAIPLDHHEGAVRNLAPAVLAGLRL